ncbi:unnamed protein product [Schistosoma turkestanicum]|nr:unnamed protein product [Schistosoma turkestanicum]
MKLFNQLKTIRLFICHRFHRLFNSNNKCFTYFIIIILITILYLSILMKLFNLEVTNTMTLTTPRIFVQITNYSLSSNYSTIEAVIHLTTNSVPLITTKMYYPRHRYYRQHHHSHHSYRKMRFRKMKSLKTIKSKRRINSRVNQKTKLKKRVSSRNLFPSLYLNSSFCLKQSNFYIGNAKHVKSKRFQQIMKLNTALTPLNKSQWLKIAPNICQSAKTNLLIITFSPVEDSSTRDKIRQTWGSVKYILSETTTSGQYYNGLNIIEHLFVVNISKWHFKQNSKTVQNLLKEAQNEKDVLPLFLTGLQSNYASLHILTSEFLLHHCKNSVDFVLFINEDLFPNINALIQYTNSKLSHYSSSSLKQNNNSPTMYCIPIIQKRVDVKNRLKDYFKNHLPSWHGNIYPTHCDIQTSGFLLLFETMKQWFTCSRLYIPFNPIQVYLTGLVREKANIYIESYWTHYWSVGNLLPSVSLNQKSKKYLFFQKSINQNSRVWKSVFRAILSQ